MPRAPIASALTLACMLALHPSTQAADFTWQGSSGAWSDPSHWLGGFIPVNDPATRAILNGPDPSTTYTLDATRPLWLVNSIIFGSTSQLNVAAGTTLEFGGVNPSIQPPFLGQVTIQGPVVLDNVVSVNAFGGAGTLNLSGSISGSGGLRLNSPATLSGTNTFTGGVTLGSTGGLSITNPESLGSGSVTLERDQTGGTIELQAANGALTDLGHAVIINSSGTSLSFPSYLAAKGASSGELMVVPSVIANGIVPLQVGSSIGSTGDISWKLSSIQLNGTLSIGRINEVSHPQMTGEIILGPILETSPSALVVNDGSALRLIGASGYSGGTTLNLSHVIADVPLALGTGAITGAFDSTLTLNATNAAMNTIKFGIVEYNANGAAGGHSIQEADVRFGPAVTSLSNGTATDTLVNLKGLRAGASLLSTFDRGLGGGSANISFQPGAVIQNTEGGLPTVQNLGTNADLILGMAGQNTLPVTLGAGTPWGGMTAKAYRGTATVSSDVSLDGMYVSGSDSSFTILASGAPVNITLYGSLALSSASFPGAQKFIATYYSALLADNALGGGGGSQPVPIDVPAGANLSIYSSAAINSPATFHANATLSIYTAGINGTGALSRDPGPLMVMLGHPLALSGNQLSGFIHAGDTVQLGVDAIQGLSTLDTGVNYFIGGGTVSLSGVINLSGGGVRLQGFPLPNVALQPLPGTDLVLEVGPSGATFASNNIGRISARIHAAGNVTAQAFQSGSSQSITFDNTSNQFQGLTITGTTVAFASPAAATGATLNLQGGRVAFAGDPAGAPVQYDNRINILTNSSISSARSLSLPTGPIVLSNVWLGNATLTFDNFVSPLTFSSLTLSGNGAISTPTGGAGTLTLKDIGQDGVTARSLQLRSSVSFTNFINYFITGSVTSTGPITMSTGTVIDGIISTGSAALTMNGPGTLAGAGTIHRPVTVTGTVFTPTLSPGSYSPTGQPLPGTLTVDSLILGSSAQLTWDLGQPGIAGGATNDLVAVGGNLTFDGGLKINPGPGFTSGHYTLFTYGGTLNNLGVNLPTLAGYSFALDFSTANEIGLNVTKLFHSVQSGAYSQNFTGNNYDLVKSTGATATLTGNNTYTGVTTVNAGTLEFNPDQNSTFSLSILSGATARFTGTGSTFTKPFSIAGSANAWTGLFDITRYSLISPQSAGGALVPNQIRQAANLGAWNGTGGITSSSAQAAATSSTATALAYATGAQFTAGNGQHNFNGLPFNPTDTLVMYTLAGDANMDKIVTFADFLQLQNHYNQPSDWQGGDFNYDGSTTFADFLILQNNYNKALTAANFLPTSNSPSDFSLQTSAFSPTPIPEPASLFLLLPSLLLLTRRRSASHSEFRTPRPQNHI